MLGEALAAPTPFCGGHCGPKVFLIVLLRACRPVPVGVRTGGSREGAGGGLPPSAQWMRLPGWVAWGCEPLTFATCSSSKQWGGASEGLLLPLPTPPRPPNPPHSPSFCRLNYG